MQMGNVCLQISKIWSRVAPLGFGTWAFCLVRNSSARKAEGNVQHISRVTCEVGVGGFGGSNETWPNVQDKRGILYTAEKKEKVLKTLSLKLFSAAGKKARDVEGAGNKED